MLLSQFCIRLALRQQGRFAEEDGGLSDELKRSIIDKVREKLELKSDSLVKLGPEQFAAKVVSDLMPLKLPSDFDIDSIDLNEVVTDDNVNKAAAVVRRIVDDVVKETTGKKQETVEKEKVAHNAAKTSSRKSLLTVVDLLLKSANVPVVYAKNRNDAVNKLADRYIHVARLLTAEEKSEGKWEPVRTPGAKSKWRYMVKGEPVAYSAESEKPTRPPKAKEISKPKEEKKPKEKTPEQALRETALKREDFTKHNTSEDRKKFLDRVVGASPIGGGKGSLKFDIERDSGRLDELRQDIRENPAYSGWKESTSKSGRTVTITPPFDSYVKTGLDYEKILQNGAVERQKKEEKKHKELAEKPLGEPERQRPKELIETERPGGEVERIVKPLEEPSGPKPEEKKPGKKPQEVEVEKPVKPGEPAVPAYEEAPVEFGEIEKPSPKKKEEEKFRLEDLDVNKFELEGEEGEKELTLEDVLRDPSKMELAPKTLLKPSWTPREKEKGVTPGWYNPDDLIDPRTPEGKKKMRNRNFSTGSLTDAEGKPLDDIPSTTMFYNIYDGKSYSFDEFPEELKNELKERQKRGELNLAPPMDPEDIPEEILEKAKAAMERAKKLSEETAREEVKPSKVVKKVSQFFEETEMGSKNLYDFATSQLSKTKIKGKKIRDVVGSIFSKYFSVRGKSLRPQKKKPLATSIESRVLLSFMADRVASAELWRLSVKDKDIMDDTGGKTKRRQPEPKEKPPRDDLKVRWRKRRLEPSEMDPDTQRDPDIDDDPDMQL